MINLTQYKILYFILFVGFGLAWEAEDDINESNDIPLGSVGLEKECQIVCVDIFCTQYLDGVECEHTNQEIQLYRDPVAKSACERGCRFFSLVYLKDNTSLNSSYDDCMTSCTDAYPDQCLLSACQQGCKNIQKIKQDGTEHVILYWEKELENEDIAETADKNSELENDIHEVSMFMENYIASEINEKSPSEYKIPETHYRILPIGVVIEKPDPSEMKGDWLDCASRNSGIPKWILVSAIISAILVALYLSISSEKKVIGDDLLLGQDEDDSEDQQAEALPTKVPLPDDNIINLDEDAAATTDEEKTGFIFIGVSDLTQMSLTNSDVAFSKPICNKHKHSVETDII